MSEYLVIIERTDQSFAAYSPDVPGCVATGDTREETLQLMQGAIARHLRGLREDGLPLPAPTSSAEYLAVAI